jgi:hypothetical protein
MLITLEIVQPLVGSHFTAHTSAGQVELLLSQAEERPRGGLPAHLRTPLSLLFSGPASPQLGQDNYTLEHPALGQVVWFMVPVMAAGTPTPPGMAYEVLFA